MTRFEAGGRRAYKLEGLKLDVYFIVATANEYQIFRLFYFNLVLMTFSF